MSNKTFESNAIAWLKTQTHIGLGHPAVFGLLEAAKELDAKWTTSLWAEYNKTIRYIESLQPVKTEQKKVDPLLSPAVPGLETRGV